MLEETTGSGPGRRETGHQGCEEPSLSKDSKTWFWRPGARQWGLSAHRLRGLRQGERHLATCLSVTHLLSLGPSITTEARKPWRSLWGDRKSLFPGRGETKLSTHRFPLPPGFSSMPTAPGQPLTPTHPPTPQSLTTGPGGPA